MLYFRFQAQQVCLVTAKTEARDKPEPKVSQETPAPTVSLDLRALLASATQPSVPTMPAWHNGPTTKMWRGLKEEEPSRVGRPAVFMNLIKNQELFFLLTSVQTAEATGAAGQILCFDFGTTLGMDGD